MKPKFHCIPFALLGIPFLLLSPAVHAQDQLEEKAAEIAEAEETEENGNARRAKETAERAREIADRAQDDAKEADKTKETPLEKGNARRAKEVAERAEKAAERAEEAAERGKERAERAKEASEHGKETAERAKEAAENARERAMERAEEAREKGKENAEAARERAKEADERGKETAEDAKERAEEAAVDREIVKIPASEPERQAETQVTEVTREVLRDLEQRKARIEGREQAQALIDDILGAESRISRAEIAREERFRQRFERQRPGQERIIEVTPDQRREATTYYQERLLGREVEGPLPEFFRRSEFRYDRRDVRVVEQVEIVRPRYFNEGRRYVHYDSRASIPAVLMAAQAMDYVRFQPTREIAPIFHGRQQVSAPYAMPLPPQNYRGQDSVVVSYPVDEKSMISSEAIHFLQGSTQFSDPYSYDVVAIMADAMKAMPEEERFVIEGHASAEGSYESNMILSQHRAELIVREIVRRGGVSPYRLLPVGYGESEARHPENADERLRSQDRRVVVFRMKSEPIAKR